MNGVSGWGFKVSSNALSFKDAVETKAEPLTSGGPDLRFVDPAIISDVDAALEGIGLLLLGSVDGVRPAPLEALRCFANQIHQVSGSSGLAALGVAAFMLASYLNLLDARGDWDAEGVEIYYDAMRTLRAGAPTARAQEILDGLMQLSNRGSSRPGPHRGFLGQDPACETYLKRRVR